MSTGSNGGRPPAFDRQNHPGRNVVERCVNRPEQLRDPLHPPAVRGRGRERVPGGGQVAVPAGGHLRSPVEHGHRVRYFTAADLVEALYRGLADNSVGKMIDAVLRHDLIIIDEIGFAPLDDTAAQLLFRLVAAYERRSLAVGSHWPFEQWGRFLPEHTTAVSLLDRLLHHANVVVTDGESYRMREARTKGAAPMTIS